MTKPHAHVVVLCTLMLASCLMLAQQNAPNTQGVTPPPGSPTPTPARMTFFVTSVGLGKGGDLGGLAGADAHCQALAAAVGAGGRLTGQNRTVLRAREGDEEEADTSPFPGLL